MNFDRGVGGGGGGSLLLKKGGGNLKPKIEIPTLPPLG